MRGVVEQRMKKKDCRRAATAAAAAHSVACALPRRVALVVVRVVLLRVLCALVRLWPQVLGRSADCRMNECSWCQPKAHHKIHHTRTQCPFCSSALLLQEKKKKLGQAPHIGPETQISIHKHKKTTPELADFYEFY